MDKTKVTFSLTKNTVKRMNQLSRMILPNKSKLIERLLKEWLDKMDKENIS